jgi:putative SOS response-associated peptidase YedK
MCGRFVQTKRARDHAKLLTIREEMEAPRPETWNLAPSTRLPAAKITQIKEFTPATWARAKAKEKILAQAA